MTDTPMSDRKATYPALVVDELRAELARLTRDRDGCEAASLSRFDDIQELGRDRDALRSEVKRLNAELARATEERDAIPADCRFFVRHERARMQEQAAEIKLLRERVDRYGAALSKLLTVVEEATTDESEGGCDDGRRGRSRVV